MNYFDINQIIRFAGENINPEKAVIAAVIAAAAGIIIFMKRRITKTGKMENYTEYGN